MRRLSDPFSVARAWSLEVLSHVVIRDRRTALERAEELSLIATEHGMPFHVAAAAFNRGWALADEGRGRKVSPRCHEPFRPLRAPRRPLRFTADSQIAIARTGARKKGLQRWPRR